MENEKFIINEKNNIIELLLDEKIYNLTVIKKALFNFINDGYYTLKHSDENEILVQIFCKDDINKDQLVKELYNELLNESLRFDVMMQTKNIRELILGRALYTTCIDTEDNKKQSYDNNEDYNINDIAVNWFDENRGKKC